MILIDKLIQSSIAMTSSIEDAVALHWVATKSNTESNPLFIQRQFYFSQYPSHLNSHAQKLLGGQGLGKSTVFQLAFSVITFYRKINLLQEDH
eukprot:scaffold8443_cov97-Skeletonema_menzelii.AAC.1